MLILKIVNIIFLLLAGINIIADIIKRNKIKKKGIKKVQEIADIIRDTAFILSIVILLSILNYINDTVSAVTMILVLLAIFIVMKRKGQK